MESILILYSVMSTYQVVNDMLIPLLVCRATPESSQALKYIAAATKTVGPVLRIVNALFLFYFIFL